MGNRMGVNRKPKYITPTKGSKYKRNTQAHKSGQYLIRTDSKGRKVTAGSAARSNYKRDVIQSVKDFSRSTITPAVSGLKQYYSKTHKNDPVRDIAVSAFNKLYDNSSYKTDSDTVTRADIIGYGTSDYNKIRQKKRNRENLQKGITDPDSGYVTQYNPNTGKTGVAQKVTFDEETGTFTNEVTGKNISLDEAVNIEVENYENAGYNSKWFDKNIATFQKLMSGYYSPTLTDKERSELISNMFREGEHYVDGQIVTDSKTFIKKNADMLPVSKEDMVINLFREKYYNEDKQKWAKDTPEPPLYWDEDKGCYIKTDSYVEPSESEYKAYLQKLEDSWNIGIQNQLHFNESEKDTLEKMKMTAGALTDVPDTLFDAAVKNSFLHGSQSAHADNVHDRRTALVRSHIFDPGWKPFFKDFKTYVTNYVWNPIKSGDPTTVALNALTNFNDCVDGLALGVRALASSKVNIYGSGDHTYETQKDWVYSGGHTDGFTESDQTLGLVERYKGITYKNILDDTSKASIKELKDKFGLTSVLKREDFDTDEEYKIAKRNDIIKQAADIVKEYRRITRTQKKLMKLGAEALLDGGITKSHRKFLEQQIKDAGMWEDYCVLRDDWEKADHYDNPFNRLAQAYTQYDSNFLPESGSIAKDTLTYLYTDPTMYLSLGSSAILKMSSKSAAKTALKGAEKEVLDHIGFKKPSSFRDRFKAGYSVARDENGELLPRDLLQRPDYTKEDEIVINTFKKDAKYLGKDITTLSTDEITTRATRTIDSLVEKDIIPITQRNKYIDLYKSGFTNIQDNLNYKIAARMSEVEAVTDIFDYAMLAGGLPAPAATIAAYKGGRKLLHTNKVTSRLLKERSFKKRLIANRAYKSVTGLDGHTSIIDIAHLVNEVNASEASDTLTLAKAKADYKKEENYIKKLNEIVSDNNDLRYDVLKQQVDSEISTLFTSRTGGYNITSLDQLETVLTDVFSKLTGNSDEADALLDEFLVEVRNLKKSLDRVKAKEVPQVKIDDIDIEEVSAEVAEEVIKSKLNTDDSKVNFDTADPIPKAYEGTHVVIKDLFKDIVAHFEWLQNNPHKRTIKDADGNFLYYATEAPDPDFNDNYAEYILRKDSVKKLLWYTQQPSNTIDAEQLTELIAKAYQELYYDFYVLAPQKFPEMTGTAKEFYELVNSSDAGIFDSFSKDRVDEVYKYLYTNDETDITADELELLNAFFSTRKYDEKSHTFPQTPDDVVDVLSRKGDEYIDVKKASFDNRLSTQSFLSSVSADSRDKFNFKKVYDAYQGRKEELRDKMQRTLVGEKGATVETEMNKYVRVVGYYNKLSSGHMFKTIEFLKAALEKSKEMVTDLDNISKDVYEMRPEKVNEFINIYHDKGAIGFIAPFADPSTPLGGLVSNRSFYIDFLNENTSFGDDIRMMEQFCNDLNTVESMAKTFMAIKTFISNLSNDLSDFERNCVLEFIFNLSYNRRMSDVTANMRNTNFFTNGLKEFIYDCCHTPYLVLENAKKTMRLDPRHASDARAFWGRWYKTGNNSITTVAVNKEGIRKISEENCSAALFQYLIRDKDAITLLNKYCDEGNDVIVIDVTGSDSLETLSARKYNRIDETNDLTSVVNAVNSTVLTDFTGSESEMLVAFSKYMDDCKGRPKLIIHDPDNKFTELLKNRFKYYDTPSKYGNFCGDIVDKRINIYDMLRRSNAQKNQVDFTDAKKAVVVEHLRTLVNALDPFDRSLFFDADRFKKATERIGECLRRGDFQKQFLQKIDPDLMQLQLYTPESFGKYYGPVPDYVESHPLRVTDEYHKKSSIVTQDELEWEQARDIYGNDISDIPADDHGFQYLQYLGINPKHPEHPSDMTSEQLTASINAGIIDNMSIIDPANVPEGTVVKDVYDIQDTIDDTSDASLISKSCNTDYSLEYDSFLGCYVGARRSTSQDNLRMSEGFLKNCYTFDSNKKRRYIRSKMERATRRDELNAVAFRLEADFISESNNFKIARDKFLRILGNSEFSNLLTDAMRSDLKYYINIINNPIDKIPGQVIDKFLIKAKFYFMNRLRRLDSEGIKVLNDLSDSQWKYRTFQRDLLVKYIDELDKLGNFSERIVSYISYDKSLKNINSLLNSKDDMWLDTSFDAWYDHNHLYFIDNKDKVISSERRNVDLYNYFSAQGELDNYTLPSSKHIDSYADSEREVDSYNRYDEEHLKNTSIYRLSATLKKHLVEFESIAKDLLTHNEAEELLGVKVPIEADDFYYMCDVLHDMIYTDSFNALVPLLDSFIDVTDFTSSEFKDFLVSMRDFFNELGNATDVNVINYGFNEYAIDVLLRLPDTMKYASEVIGRLDPWYLVKHADDYAELCSIFVSYRRMLKGYYPGDRTGLVTKLMHGSNELDVPTEYALENTFSSTALNHFNKIFGAFLSDDGFDIKGLQYFYTKMKNDRFVNNELHMVGVDHLLNALPERVFRVIEEMNNVLEMAKIKPDLFTPEAKNAFLIACQKMYYTVDELANNKINETIFGTRLDEVYSEFLTVACNIEREAKTKAFSKMTNFDTNYNEILAAFGSDEYKNSLAEFESFQANFELKFALQRQTCINAPSFEGFSGMSNYSSSIAATPADFSVRTGNKFKPEPADYATTRAEEDSRIEHYFPGRTEYTGYQDYSEVDAARKNVEYHKRKFEKADNVFDAVNERIASDVLLTPDGHNAHFQLEQNSEELKTIKEERSTQRVILVSLKNKLRPIEKRLLQIANVPVDLYSYSLGGYDALSFGPRMLDFGFGFENITFLKKDNPFVGYDPLDFGFDNTTFLNNIDSSSIEHTSVKFVDKKRSKIEHHYVPVDEEALFKSPFYSDYMRLKKAIANTEKELEKLDNTYKKLIHNRYKILEHYKTHRHQHAYNSASLQLNNAKQGLKSAEDMLKASEENVPFVMDNIHYNPEKSAALRNARLNLAKKVDELVNKIESTTLINEHISAFQYVITRIRQFANSLDIDQPYRFLADLEVPSDSKELFSLAYVLYDSFIKPFIAFSDSKVGSFLGSLEHVKPAYRDAAYSAGTSPIAEIADEFVHDLQQSGAYDILSGVFDPIIFNHSGSNLNMPAKLILRLNNPTYVSATTEYLRQTRETYNTLASRFGNDTTSTRDFAMNSLSDNLTETLHALNRLQSKDSKYFDAARIFLDTAKKDMFIRSSLQIMDYISEGVDNLINHLIYHNQLLVIPRSGSDEFMKYYNKLDKLQKGAPDFLVFQEEGDYLLISFARDTKMYKKGKNFTLSYAGTEYGTVFSPDVFAERYKRIFIPRINETDLPATFLAKFKDANEFLEFKKLMDDINDKLDDCYDQLDYLSGGTINGSVITPYTLDRHNTILKQLPIDFRNKTIEKSVTCDDVMFNRAQYDMTLLASEKDSTGINRFLVNSFDDSDILCDMNRCYEDMAGTVSSTRLYISNFFDKNCSSKMSALFKDLSKEEMLETLTSNSDQCVISLRSSKNSFSGYNVKLFNIKDTLDVDLALREDAIIVPYDVYVEMTRVINESSLNKTFLKVWAQLVFFLKVGHLCNPGTWMRNWVDATIKATGETGSFGETARGQYKAMKLLSDYTAIVKQVKTATGDYTASLNKLELNWKTYQRRAHSNLSFDEFIFLEDWLKVSLSGGESRMLSEFFKRQNKDVFRNQNLKKGSSRTLQDRTEAMESFDLINNNINRFEDLGDKEIKNLIDSCNRSHRTKYELFDHNFTEENFWEIFYARQAGDTSYDESAAFLRYKDSVNTILMKRNSRWARSPRGTYSGVDFLCSLCLKPMSKIEQVVRLGQYLTLEEKGYTKSQIFKSIADTQFEYELKSTRIKHAELFVTYANFEWMNTRYWLQQLETNPKFIYTLSRMWGGLSWEACKSYTDNEDYYNNKSIEYMMLHGALPIGDEGLYLKMFPSALGALNWFYGLPSQTMQAVLPPLETLGKEALLHMGGDYAALLSNLDYSYSDESTFEKVLNNIPIAGTIYTRYIEHFKDRRPWERLTNEDFQTLAKWNPSIWGAANAYRDSDADSFEDFQNQLAQQGKWYDCNLCRVVDISKKNDTGLNNPDLSFAERKNYMMEYRGLIWDQNWCGFKDGEMKYGHFTTLGDAFFNEDGSVKPIGLNRTFDFTQDGVFDKFEELEWKYHGRKWDANKQKFVAAADWEPGGLNDEFDFENNPNDWYRWNYQLNLHGFYYDMEAHKIKKLSKDEQWHLNQFNTHYYRSGWKHFNRWINYGNYPPAVRYQMYGGRTYNKSKSFNSNYTTSSNYATYRMQSAGYRSYKEYYNFDFSYNYRYRYNKFRTTVKRYNPVIRHHLSLKNYRSY